ncbi:Small-conductance mechanosensitive channel [Anatilimnocola aggregata]|uniref:Small-conductance mechanosensitive channel n=1 Tax=Anatilimnocola aggregata TaxID=2528021 RepID=A0A517YEN3_9BACT|nr:mechanosensitive ion channel family protein [Anatilimnocola aggregata]QDU28668.1 Small-conductance mechanosensitive channel [Anatilimnocola aggregata]
MGTVASTKRRTPDWRVDPRKSMLREVVGQRYHFLTALIIGAITSSLLAQPPSDAVGSSKKNIPKQVEAPEKEDLTPATAKVDINPVARDEEIRTRLQSVLDATGWFIDPQVEVREGVVFLSGYAETDELKKWAGDLARNTQDVVAVANRMDVLEPSVWDFEPAWTGMLALWRDFIRSLPFFLFGLLILALSAGAGVLATRGAQAFFRERIQARLLLNVMARGIGVLVFLLGVYIILRVSGLTQLALTVVGGTGLVGLAVGIAFRDITENFLASIFLSMHRPFETGDLVEISAITGYVQQLNIRTTILMTLDGNLVQIPNATVYKNNIRNFTTNANRREDFVVGIGYDSSISEAQEIARQVLSDHPAVLSDPEPMVLADSMGTATINLRIYFWLNGREHSLLKVRSSLIRLVKMAFQKNGVSMPDEAREIVFPNGVPVTMAGRKSSEAPPFTEPAPLDSVENEVDEVSTKAECDLSSDAGAIEEQARQVRPLNDGDNLLRSSPNPSAPKIQQSVDKS